MDLLVSNKRFYRELSPTMSTGHSAAIEFFSQGHYWGLRVCLNAGTLRIYPELPADDLACVM